MRRAIFLCLVLFFAGCMERSVPATPAIEFDALTPGTWRVSASVEYLMAWVHNPTKDPVEVEWSLRLPNATALPAGWNVTFGPAKSHLEPAGTKRPTQSGFDYADWRATFITLSLPANVATDSSERPSELVLSPGRSNETIRMEYADRFERVSRPGDHVTIGYAGHYQANGTRFDAGEFPTTLGRGDTVPGFDYGLMGLAQNENTTIILPPPLAYGYDNEDEDYVRFNGQTLRFHVEIKEWTTGN